MTDWRPRDADPMFGLAVDDASTHIVLPRATRLVGRRRRWPTLVAREQPSTWLAAAAAASICERRHSSSKLNRARQCRRGRSRRAGRHAPARRRPAKRASDLHTRAILASIKCFQLYASGMSISSKQRCWHHPAHLSRRRRANQHALRYVRDPI